MNRLRLLYDAGGKSAEHVAIRQPQYQAALHYDRMCSANKLHGNRLRRKQKKNQSVRRATHESAVSAKGQFFEPLRLTSQHGVSPCEFGDVTKVNPVLKNVT